MEKIVIIEIKGAGSQNKGAEMMLLTILQELKKTSSEIKFTVTPCIGVCEYGFFSKYGLYPKVWLSFKGFQFGRLGRFIPKKIRTMYGLITNDEIDVVLDASGFAYSDQWGEYPAKVMAQETKKWKKKGKKIILMPQAFGPFKTQNIQDYMKEIIENADIVYARDDYSYQSLLKLVNDTDKIRMAPDFTMLFKGKTPTYFDKTKHQICIVPNMRIIDKRKDSSCYKELFVKIIRYFQENCLVPFFLIHGGEEDLEIANKINERLENKIEIINEKNPLLIKGLILESIGQVGSRFHSLASALYSSTVAIGTGWSHKYEYLFKGFDFEEGLIELNLFDEQLYEKLNFIVDKKKRQEKIKKIELKTIKQKEQSEQMFKEIKEYIGLVN